MGLLDADAAQLRSSALDLSGQRAQVELASGVEADTQPGELGRVWSRQVATGSPVARSSATRWWQVASNSSESTPSSKEPEEMEPNSRLNTRKRSRWIDRSSAWSRAKRTTYRPVCTSQSGIAMSRGGYAICPSPTGSSKATGSSSGSGFSAPRHGFNTPAPLKAVYRDDRGTARVTPIDVATRASLERMLAAYVEAPAPGGAANVNSWPGRTRSGAMLKLLRAPCIELTSKALSRGGIE